jgi:hypothetical protein
MLGFGCRLCGLGIWLLLAIALALFGVLGCAHSLCFLLMRAIFGGGLDSCRSGKMNRSFIAAIAGGAGCEGDLV